MYNTVGDSMPKKVKPVDIARLYEMLKPIVNGPRKELERVANAGQHAADEQYKLGREIDALEADDDPRAAAENRNEIRAIRDEIAGHEPTRVAGMAAQRQIDAIDKINKKHHEVCVEPEIKQLKSKRDALENAIARLEQRMENCELSMENDGYSDQAHEDFASELAGMSNQYDDLRRDLLRIETKIKFLQTTK